MEWLGLLLLAAPLLGAAVYAQYRIRFHTGTARDALLGRLLLWLVGVAFGWALAVVYTHSEGLRSLLWFAIGFGAVHVPAAFILFSKRRRGVHH